MLDIIQPLYLHPPFLKLLVRKLENPEGDLLLSPLSLDLLGNPPPPPSMPGFPSDSPLSP